MNTYSTMTYVWFHTAWTSLVLSLISLAIGNIISTQLWILTGLVLLLLASFSALKALRLAKLTKVYTEKRS